MTQGKTIIIMLVVLVIGFGSRFVLRPVIVPPEVAAAAPSFAPSSGARGVEYFVAPVAEARELVEGCRDGSVRGAECANAEEAFIKIEADERRRRFLRP